MYSSIVRNGHGAIPVLAQIQYACLALIREVLLAQIVVGTGQMKNRGGRGLKTSSHHQPIISVDEIQDAPQ